MSNEEVQEEFPRKEPTEWIAVVRRVAWEIRTRTDITRVLVRVVVDV